MEALSGQAATVLGTMGAIAAPALVGMTLFHATGDPRLQPLGLTEERMTRIPPPVQPGLVRAELHVPAETQDTEELLAIARQIKSTFAAKGQEAWVLVLRAPEAEQPYILYRVGSNVLGPYRLGEAVRGVTPAVLAVRSFE